MIALAEFGMSLIAVKARNGESGYGSTGRSLCIAPRGERWHHRRWHGRPELVIRLAPENGVSLGEAVPADNFNRQGGVHYRQDVGRSMSRSLWIRFSIKPQT